MSSNKSRKIVDLQNKQEWTNDVLLELTLDYILQLDMMGADNLGLEGLEKFLQKKSDQEDEESYICQKCKIEEYDCNCSKN
jgi:hypothetical protein